MSRTELADDGVLVVGTGYLGLRFLEQSGDAVLGLSRTAISASRPVVTWDLDAGAELPVALPERYTVLYTVPPAATAVSDVRLRNLLDRLSPLPARFVYISTTGVYGDRGGETVAEMTPVNATSGRARRRVAAEELLHGWGAQAGCDILILRVPGIYGPGRLGIERIRDGLPVIDAAETGPGNRIHVDDLVLCCNAAVTTSVPAGIYNVGDGDHRSSTWFTNEIARQCDLPAPPTITMAEAEQQFSPMRMSFLRESRLVDTTKMRETLGVTPRYADPSEGIRASLEQEQS